MTPTCQGATTAPECQSCDGPLASHVQSFAAQLSGQGYAQESIRAKCDLLTDLSRWLQRRQLPLEALVEGRLKQFLATRRRGDQMRRGDPATVRQLLQHLRDLGNVAAPVQSFDRSPQACLTRDFERFLYSERGLSRSTVVSYLHIVQRFLGERFGRKELHLEQLRPKDLHGFILRQIQRVSRTHGKAVVTALRAFLRWLLQRGAIGADLAVTVPGVATWRLSHLPKSLPAEQVERLLAGCDRSTATGKRDYAILLLLARLGVDAGRKLTSNRGWGSKFGRRGQGTPLRRLREPTLDETLVPARVPGSWVTALRFLSLRQNAER